MDALASPVDRASNSNSTAAPPLSAEQQHGSELLTAWLALQLAGQATLPFLVLTMLFHKKITRRNPTIINLCIVWAIGTIPPLLLFYAGKHTGRAPDTLLCLAQAATVGAVPPMASVAYLSVVIHACTVIHGIINANTVRPISIDYRIILVSLISSPYVTFLTFSLLIAIVGAQNPGDVHRGQFFCEVENHRLSLPVFGFSIVVVLLTLVAQVWISVMFYRNWSAKRSGRVAHRDVSQVDFQFLLRMLFFTVFEAVVLVSCVGAVLNPNLGALNLLRGTPPFAVFLIFAGSKDILRAWFPCFFPRKPTRSLADVEITSQVPITGTLDETTPRQSSVSSLGRPVMVEVHPRRTDLEMGVAPVSPSLAPKSQREEIMTAIRTRRYDLEMGVPLVSSPLVPKYQRDSTENTTKVAVYPASSNPESPLHAIRSLRTPAMPRPVIPK